MAGMTQQSGEPTWSSRAAFVLAAIGSAVGLGNLWRFPYQAGENGGGAFVLVYILCVLLIGLPVLAAELFVGRRGGGSSIAAVKRLAQAEGKTGLWSLFAWMGMITSFLIVTFYSVIAGWVLYFVIELFRDLFASIGRDGVAALSGGAFAGQSAEEVSGKLGGLLQQPGKMITFHAIFMSLNVFILARGVKGGIEKAVTILMPSFFVMLIVLVIFAMVTGDTGQAAAYLFMPDFAKLGPILADGSILQAALGQAFFSIGLGSALMITYGMYMNKSTNIPGASRTVAIADTGVALIAGMAIFPIVFKFGLEPSGGPGLMFSTLPLAFQQMPFGSLFGIMFFMMALFAALTSSISLLEVATAFADGDIGEENRAKKRVVGAIIIGIACFAIGVLNALSQVPFDPNLGNQPPLSQPNFWNQWVPIDSIHLFEGRTLLDFLDQLTGQVFLPLGGFLTAIFAGWVVSKTASREELGFESEAMYNRWYFLIRWVCPIAVGLVLVYSMFLAPILAG